MAGLILNVNSGEVSLAANTPKTALQVKMPANQRGVLKGIKILGKQPAGGTDVPIKVRLTRSTANFGTGSPATPHPSDPSWTETPQSVWAANFTTEPTAPTDTGKWWEVQPQSGVIEYFATGLEDKVPGGQALNVELTSTGTPTVLVSAVYDE